jgi:hypothetical protein
MDERVVSAGRYAATREQEYTLGWFGGYSLGSSHSQSKGKGSIGVQSDLLIIIKEKSLNKHTTRLYRAPKEVDLTQLKPDHPNKRAHVSILHKKNNQYGRSFVI